MPHGSPSTQRSASRRPLRYRCRDVLADSVAKARTNLRSLHCTLGGRTELNVTRVPYAVIRVIHRIADLTL